VLGRYDENTKPTSVTGARLDPATGQAKIALTAGGEGEQVLDTYICRRWKTIPLKFRYGTKTKFCNNFC
jgi:hypothetical protein